MKTLNMIAIIESEQRKVGIPIELVEQLNEQMENFPEGMPMDVGNGETIVVLALMLPTKKMKGSVIMFGSDDIWAKVTKENVTNIKEKMTYYAKKYRT